MTKWAFLAWTLTTFLIASFCVHHAIDLNTHQGWAFAGLFFAGIGGFLAGFRANHQETHEGKP